MTELADAPTPQDIVNSRALAPRALRHAFPAHWQLEQTGLVYRPDGIGHARNLGDGSGSRLLCGTRCWPHNDIHERWHHTNERGASILPRLGCPECADEVAARRDAALDEADALRETLAALKSSVSVLDALADAARP